MSADVEAALAALRATLGSRARRAAREREGRTRAAVLVPLVVREGALEALLIRRPDDAPAHPGQVACPGGRLRAGEDPAEGALREAEEELGIPPARVELLGALHDVDATTGYVITPWVGRVPPDLALRPDPREVAHAFSVPVDALRDRERTRFEERPYELSDGRTVRVPYWHWEGELIWGATGRMLTDLLSLLDPVGWGRPGP